MLVVSTHELRVIHARMRMVPNALAHVVASCEKVPYDAGGLRYSEVIAVRYVS